MNTFHVVVQLKAAGLFKYDDLLVDHQALKG